MEPQGVALQKGPWWLCTKPKVNMLWGTLQFYTQIHFLDDGKKRICTNAISLKFHLCLISHLISALVESDLISAS